MNERLVKYAYEILNGLFCGHRTEAEAFRVQQWLMRNIHHKEVDRALRMHFDRLVDAGCDNEPAGRSFETGRWWHGRGAAYNESEEGVLIPD